MDRRTYLSSTATATLAGATGCQDALSGTETEDDDDTEGSGARIAIYVHFGSESPA